jgi:hypothetical protein
MERQWPLKIQLVHPEAPFLQDAHVTIAADCVAVVHPNIHEMFGTKKIVLTGCPLLENPDNLLRKLSVMIEKSNIKEMAIYTMEVPCCHALHFMVEKALAENVEKRVPVSSYIVRVMSGEVEPYNRESFRIDEKIMKLEREAHKGLHGHHH